jgi:hypothetical protein
MNEESESELERLQCFPFHLPVTLGDGVIRGNDEDRLIEYARSRIVQEVERLTNVSWMAIVRSDGYDVQFVLGQDNFRSQTPPMEIHRLAAVDLPLRLSQYAAIVARQWQLRTS